MRGKFLKTTGLLAAVLVFAGLCLLGYAILIEPNRLVVNEKRLEIQGWNREFDDFKIVAISDIHGGSSFIDEAKIRTLVRMANEQNPDLVVLLGDFVSQNREDKPIRERSLKMPMGVIASNLKGLRAKYGVVAVIGNHDWWYNDEVVAAELREVGIRVLVNELFTIERQESKLHVLGLIDNLKIRNRKRFAGNIRSKLDSENLVGNLLILDHSPDLVPLVAGKNPISENAKLYLAGHTHGGQVWFPFVGSLVVPSDYGDRYAYGHIKEGEIDVFVTTGIGTSIAPIRFLVPPEIAVLTIKSK